MKLICFTSLAIVSLEGILAVGQRVVIVSLEGILHRRSACCRSAIAPRLPQDCFKIASSVFLGAFFVAEACWLACSSNQTVQRSCVCSVKTRGLLRFFAERYLLGALFDAQRACESSRQWCDL